MTALSNGNYVVGSPGWQNGAAVVGAATWSKGDGSTVGAVSTSNSLVGSINGDDVSSGGVTALSNGNYVVISPFWQSGLGAVTWSNGNSGLTFDGVGTLNAVNSYIGPGTGPLHLVLGLPTGGSFLAGFSGNNLNNLGGIVTEVQLDPNAETFGTGATQTVSLSPGFLTGTLNSGTAVVLQASNDITLNSPVVVDNPTGNGGNLTLQAGRSILLNASITTDNGNLTLIANDTTADGVLDSQRDTGNAVLTMAAGTSINAGTGTVTISLLNGSGKTNTANGVISLAAITAGSISINNSGISTGSDVDLGSLTTTGQTTTGNLSIQSAGAISQTGILTIAGTTSLVASDNITLNNNSNAFAGIVSLSAPASDVSLVSSGNLTLSVPRALSSLTVASGGALASSGSLSVIGASSFTGTSITLTNAANRFQGLVSLSSTSTIALTDASALSVGDLTLAGAATFNAPNIAFTGNLNVGSQSLTLTSTTAAHLNGTTTLATGGTVTDSTGLVVGSGASLSGSGSLQAGTGSSGVFVQPGATVSPGPEPHGTDHHRRSDPLAGVCPGVKDSERQRVFAADRQRRDQPEQCFPPAHQFVHADDSRQLRDPE